MRYLPLLVVALPISAQSIPPYVPVNPALASRSALYAQPFIGPATGWDVRIVGDYTNAVEAVSSSDQRDYAFDAEVLQLDIWISRDVSPRVFVVGNVAVRGGYDGFLDQFLNEYHDLIGFRVPARNIRAANQFEWAFELGGAERTRERPGTFIGDVRIGAGFRITPALQAMVSLTLPTTTTDIENWGRQEIGTSGSITAVALRTDRVAIDVGVSAGWTPAHGELAEFQRTVFGGALVAGRWRFSGRQSVFSTFWIQSPNWHDTGFRALDQAEITLDLGALFILRAGWPELQVGITEDLLPNGPSVDAGFKLGVRW